MTEDGGTPLSNDLVTSVAASIAEQVTRSQLQQILLQSRLVPRESTRDDLRRIRPSNREGVALRRGKGAAVAETGSMVENLSVYFVSEG
jgi:hypothetical protein